jgi:hypothetical protein
MVASLMQFWRNAVELVLVVNGHGQRTVVSVMPRGLYRAAVAAGTGPARASYDVDAAFMHLERHERGIHALCAGAAGADHDQLKLNGIALEQHVRRTPFMKLVVPVCAGRALQR